MDRLSKPYQEGVNEEMLSRLRKFAATRALRNLSLLALTAALGIACAHTCRAAETPEASPPERPAAARPAERPKCVLLIFGEDQTFPMISSMGQSIRSTLTDRWGKRIELYNESLDRTRIDEVEYERELVNFWRQKYHDQRVDLIVVCIASALDLLVRNNADLFPGAPIVYCVLFEEELSTIKVPPGATGVWSAAPFRPTLDLALALHPDTERVVVIYGTSPFEKGLLELTKSELRDFENKVEIDYLTDVTIGELQARLANLPSHTIVLFGAFTKDSAGALFTGPESLSRVSPTSSAPIYGFGSTLLGSGMVGGSLVRFDLLGVSAGEIGARILAGERTENIAPQGVPNALMFDSRELSRWGISEKNLPPDSQIAFVEQSFLEQYRLGIAAAVTLLIVQTLLIAGLWVNRARRMKAELENARLATAAKQEHVRLEEFVSNVPGVVWEMRMKPGGGGRKLEFLSNYAEKMLGYPAEEWTSKPRFWDSIVLAEDREQAVRESQEAFDSGKERTIQFRWKAKDGRVLWAESHLTAIVAESGERVGLRGVTIDITDRKAAEQAARESEQKTRAILRALPDLMFLQTPDGVFLDYHANDKSNLLVQPAEFIGKNMREVLPPELAESFFRLFRRAQETRETQVFEYALAAAGEERWFEASIVASGENILSVVRDITDNKRAQEALTENRMQLAGIIDSAMDAIISVDDEQRIVLMNPAAEQMFGCSAGKAIGQSIELFVPERFRDVHLKGFRDLSDSEAANRLVGSRMALHGRRSNGEEFPIEASISQIELRGRKFYTAILRDITARRRAEETIRASEANYRSIFNAVNDAIFVHDTETGDIVDVNQVMCDMYGYTPDEARSIDVAVLSSNEPPYTHDAAIAWISKAVEGEPQVFEWRARDKSGRQFWVEVSLKRAAIAGKDRVLAVVRDITYRKQADEALRESEERFRTMADTAPVMIWLADPNRRRTYVNQQWLDFAGRTIEEECGSGWTEGIHRDDFDRCMEGYDGAWSAREPFTVEYRLRRADGEFRWILDSGAPRFSKSKNFLGYIGSCIDITERKAAEESLADLSGQLIRAREEECARIARELHDDLNQRMALVSIELEQLGQNPPATDDDLRKCILGVRKQTTEISREIHRISYDLHPSKLIHLGLVAAVKGLCDELSASHGLKTELTQEDIPATLTQDVSLCLYRIVQECLNNVVRHSGVKEARVELRGTGSEIRLRVSDPGIGFDIESPRIRKGLGLVSMRERLRLLGGTISIESRPSHGTEIDARVPLKRVSLEYEGPEPYEQMRVAEG